MLAGMLDETLAGREERRARVGAGGELDETLAGEEERRARSGERAIAVVAARQHGMVTVGQLAAAGIGRSAVSHRVREGRLVRRHRGVYQVGPLLAPLGAEMAAVLACGSGAALSHGTAAALWGFRTAPTGIHVTVPGRAIRAPRGVRVHQALSLDAAVRQGLPLTTPARTLLDLASRLGEAELVRAAEQAQILRLTDRAELRAQTGRGAARLRAALPGEPTLTRSEAEQRLLSLIRSARLPRPETNVRIAGHEVDVVWRAARLVVEVDGYAYHSSRAAFERDRARDADLMQAGYRVLRVTWRQLTQEPEAVVARLAALLAPRA
jgi:very-short-patch-repair endonuclease